VKPFITGLNLTHYSTEDIEALARRMVRLAEEQPKQWTLRTPDEGVFGVRYCPLKDVDPDCFTVPYARANLRILRKKDINEQMHPLAVVAQAMTDEELLPPDVVAEVAAVMGRRAGLTRKKRGRPLRYTALKKEATRIVKEEGLTVRILPQPVTKRHRKRLTPAERAAHWENFYLKGRPAKRMNWRVENELRQAVRRVAETWRETLPWLEKARKEGADPKEHMTPAELLRALADEWEEERRLR
jgi:hypothetical protein